tara:strand:+ start:2601 stop:9239 length:6639 start_codon:yes stop_codon:yes gene_type:complete
MKISFTSVEENKDAVNSNKDLSISFTPIEESTKELSLPDPNTINDSEKDVYNFSYLNELIDNNNIDLQSDLQNAYNYSSSTSNNNTFAVNIPEKTVNEFYDDIYATQKAKSNIKALSPYDAIEQSLTVPKTTTDEDGNEITYYEMNFRNPEGSKFQRDIDELNRAALNIPKEGVIRNPQEQNIFNIKRQQFLESVFGSESGQFTYLVSEFVDNFGGFNIYRNLKSWSKWKDWFGLDLNTRQDGTLLTNKKSTRANLLPFLPPNAMNILQGYDDLAYVSGAINLYEEDSYNQNIQNIRELAFNAFDKEERDELLKKANRLEIEKNVIDVSSFLAALRSPLNIKNPQIFPKTVAKANAFKKTDQSASQFFNQPTKQFFGDIKIGQKNYLVATDDVLKYVNVAQRLSTGQYIALQAVLRQENITWEDRVNMYLTVSLYASTPAVSGAFKGILKPKFVDIGINSGITFFRKGGHKEILENDNLTDIDKMYKIGENIGYDVLFSLLTKSYNVDASRFAGLENYSRGLLNKGRFEKFYGTSDTGRMAEEQENFFNLNRLLDKPPNLDKQPNLNVKQLEEPIKNSLDTYFKIQVNDKNISRKEYQDVVNEAKVVLDKTEEDLVKKLNSPKPTFVEAGLIPRLPSFGKSTTTPKPTKEVVPERKIESDIEGVPPAENAQKTQNANTRGTYIKTANVLNNIIPEGQILDFGAGRGIGAEAINAKTYEPFPREGFTPNFTDVSKIPSNSESKINSSSVINVVPKDIRDGIVLDIGRILKQDGVAIITSRTEQSIKKGAENIKPFEGEEGAYIVGKEGEQTFQKGYSQKQLVEYVQGILGNDFKVTNAPKTTDGKNISGSAVLIKKLKGTEVTPTETPTETIKPVVFSEVPITTKKGTEIKRYENNVGKRVGSKIYVHRDYADEIVPKDILENAEISFSLSSLRNDPSDPMNPLKMWDYKTIVYDSSNKSVRFDESPNFDTASEPMKGKSITVSQYGDVTAAKDDFRTESIWHHKWLWVKDDYQGFNVQESKNWSGTYSPKLDEAPKGTMRAWLEQLQKYELNKPKDSEFIPPTKSIVLKDAVNKIMLDKINETKGLPSLDRLQELQILSDRIGVKLLNAPKGASVKTLVNEINTIGSTQPKITLSQNQFYKIMEGVAKKAAKETGSGIANIIRDFNTIIDRTFPYKQAISIKSQVSKISAQKLTLDEFVAKAEAFVASKLGFQARVDLAVGINKIEKGKSYSDSELLRMVLETQAKASKKAARYTVKELKTLQANARKIIKSLPAEKQLAFTKKLQDLAAVSEDVRQKRFEALEKDVAEAILKYKSKQINKEYVEAIKAAKKEIDNLSPDLKQITEKIIQEFEAGKFLNTVDKKIEKSESLIEVEALEALKNDLIDIGKKPLSEMSDIEKQMFTESLNSYIHQMKQLKADREKYGQEKAAYQTKEIQKNLTVFKAKYTDNKSIGGQAMEFAGKWFVGGSMIPRATMETLDLFNNNVFSSIQTRLEHSQPIISEVKIKANEPLDKVQQTKKQREIMRRYVKNKPDKFFRLTDKNGNPYNKQLGMADRSWIWLMSNNPDCKLCLDKFGAKITEKTDTFFVNDEAYRMIEDYMIKNNELPISQAIKEGYEISRPYIRKMSLKVDGRDITIDNFTGALLRFYRQEGAFDENFSHFNFNYQTGQGNTFGQAFRQTKVESNPRFLLRKGGSQKPLKVYNPFQMFEKTINISGIYAAQADILRDLNRLIKYSKIIGSSEKEGISLETQFDALNMKEIFNSLKEYNGILQGQGSKFNVNANQRVKDFQKLENIGFRSIGTALSINPWVAAKQVASLPASRAALSKEDYNVAIDAFLKQNGQSPLSDRFIEQMFYLRNRFSAGGSGAIYLPKELTKKEAIPFLLISKVDEYTIRSIGQGVLDGYKRKLNFSENEILNNPDIVKNIEKSIIDVISRTQPAFENIQRPLLAQTGYSPISIGFMFSSARNKLAYINYKSLMKPIVNFIGGNERPKSDRNEFFKDQIALHKSHILYTLISVASFMANKEMYEDTMDFLPESMQDEWYIKFLKDYGLNSLGAVAAPIGVFLSLYSGFGLTYNPVQPIVEAAEDVPRYSKIYDDMFFAMENGEGELWFKQNYRKLSKATSKILNIFTSTIGVGGMRFSTEQANKVFEAVDTAIKKLTANELDKQDELNADFMRKSKKELEKNSPPKEEQEKNKREVNLIESNFNSEF